MTRLFHGTRGRGGVQALVALVLLLAPPGAGAFEFLDGRLQVHGFYEAQVRGLNDDFQDEWDLAQLAHVLNVELELDAAPDGWGPFDFVSFYSRLEARYDCIWSHACGVFPSADAYGDRVNVLPGRLMNGQRSGFTMNATSGDQRRYRGESPATDFAFRGKDIPTGSRRAYGIDETVAFFSLFISPGPDQVFGDPGQLDPGPFIFSRYADCKFSTRRVPGPAPEVALSIQNLGPLDPDCFVEPLAAAADKPNPFRGATDFYGNARPDPGDLNPVTGAVGRGDLPFRQAPVLPAGAGGTQFANGLWYPNKELAKRIAKDEIDHFNGNFREAELAWNRGGSQQDEKELKELYVDLEMFDSRLWLRLGKQSIVWGKTELFRNQDQFNPQDLALSSLPSLEESRIGLWAARGVWSFYDIGPLQDVRLELGLNFDQFEGADLGRCGEPYSVVLVCAGYFGFLAHGLTGIGLAGVEAPPNPWDDSDGLEFGGRVEWRWNRFSFAVSDFYGYQDIPHIERIFHFRRNVDPETGIPRRAGARGDCDTPAFEPGGGTTFFDPRAGGVDPDCLTVDDALTEHPGNLTVFSHACASIIGLLSQSAEECGNQFFNSKVSFLSGAPVADPSVSPIVSALISNQFVGNSFAWNVASAAAGAPTFGTVPFVPLNEDPCDGLLSDCATPGPGAHAFYAGGGRSMNTSLTAEQQALLGCGEFYGTDCELDGVDLFNAEASIFLQSFPGFEGTEGEWDGTDAGLIQPGTVGYEGGPVATRDLGGVLGQLPGARGPGDPTSALDDDGVEAAMATGNSAWLYDPRVDGCTGTLTAAAVATAVADCDSSNGGAGATDLLHPFTGQRFQSEMAALSFNYLMVLASLSLPPADPMNPTVLLRPAEIDEIEPTDLFRTDGCSLSRPYLCKNFEAFVRGTRVQRNDVRAGGTPRFGRRDFQWHEGAPLVIRYERANVLGFSMDFAEDVSKSNWSLELTWVEDVPFNDADERDGLTEVDTWNMTVSVDRPTFVNFLNANRTFFVNSQWFFQYIDGFRKGFSANGPWNVLATLTVTTGYFQDRLLPAMTLVYDKRSNSGAFLPSVTYRFTESFSASVGVALFSGSVQKKTMSLVPPASGNRVGPGAYHDYAENGLSVVRERDEAFLRLKYTF